MWKGHQHSYGGDMIIYWEIFYTGCIKQIKIAKAHCLDFSSTYELHLLMSKTNQNSQLFR